MSGLSPRPPILRGLPLATALVAATYLLGCGGNGSPTAPTPATPQVIGADELPFIVTSEDPSGGALSATGTMGAFNVSVDTEAMTASIESVVREGQVGDPTKFGSPGDSLIVDATNFFRASPCFDCLQVAGLGLNGAGEVLLTIGIRHPFAMPSPLTPVEDQRWDLHAFDLEGIVVSPGTTNIVSGFSTNPDLVANPDGYTSQINSIAQTIFPSALATAYPYKILTFDNEVGNYDPNDLTGWIRLDDPRGQNVLAMGSPYKETTFRLNPANGATLTDFGLIVTAAYGKSNNGKGSLEGQRARPKYYLPEFHRKEPWRIQYEINNNILLDTDPGSTAEIKVSVWDWQHGAGLNAAFDFMTSPKNEVTRSSDVDRIELLIPDLMTTITPKTAADFTGSGQYDDPLTSTFLVLNSLQAPLGLHWGLITVVDQLDTAIEEPQWLLQRDARTFVGEAPIFRTYLPIRVPITNGNLPPVAAFSTAPFTAIEENPITISGCASADPDFGLGAIGNIVEYQWDFDFDGDPGNFSPDAITGTCAVIHPFADPIADALIGLRVKDGGLPGLESDIVTLQYDVLVSSPPSGSFLTPGDGSSDAAGTVLTFTYTASDPDAGQGPAGDIDEVAFDFEWDGDPGSFTPDLVNPTGAITWAYLTTGAKRVGLRIRDGASPPQEAIVQLDLIATAAPPPPATPVGNVTLTLNRSAANGNLPGGYRPQNISLGWADIAGEAEYSVYVDKTPYGTGEVVDDLELLAVLPANSTGYLATLPPNLQFEGAFVVRARSVVNNVLSETANSQVAFIEVEGFEPGPLNNWTVGNEDPDSSFGGNILQTTRINSGASSLVTDFADQTRGFLRDFGSISETRWSAAVSPRLPDIPSLATTVQIARIEAVHRASGSQCSGLSQAQYVFGIAKSLPGTNTGNSDPANINRPGRSFLDFRCNNNWITGSNYNVFVGSSGPGGPCGNNNNTNANGIDDPIDNAPAVLTLAASGGKRGFAFSEDVIGGVETATWLFSAFDLTADYKATAAPLYRHAGVAACSTAVTLTGVFLDIDVDDVAVIIY